MPDEVRKQLRDMFIEDAHIAPMPGQERREWFDQHPVLRTIGQMLTGGTLDPRLSDEPPGPADLLMAIGLPAAPGMLKFSNAGGLRRTGRGIPFNLAPEDFGLTPADFSTDLPKDIGYTGWNKDTSRKFSQQMQTRQGGYSGRPLNMEAIDKIARGEPVPRMIELTPNTRAGSKRLDLQLSKQGLRIDSPGMGSGTKGANDPYKFRRGQVDEKSLTEIRRLGNRVWADLTPQQAARQIKQTIDTPLTEKAIVDILKGNSFPRAGMLTRTPKE